MSYALGEIEGLCRKAAKGAGFTWGEAEETGQAIRVLAASRLPAVRTFAHYLEALEAGIVPSQTCPIRLGCQLIDGSRVSAFSCAFPLLLMPFIARVAAVQNRALLLSSEGFQATAAPCMAITLVKTTEVNCDLQLTPTAAPAAIARVYRAEASGADIVSLSQFAQRTYAPETEARRQQGAGAGNDGNR
ncbi:DUF3726 domain-containing protein [Lentibacter algarum]|uniref:DUF3726 domain-containing protein n=1 Tax=Lentibacter algarum TaxID=576131 RepID=UPI001C090F2C|nr:DUF3726 domain-containing protein [Lentibacter algarum]MBU2983003.1 DUF3726 domain-containing protein [Lentibacter algarum]